MDKRFKVSWMLSCLMFSLVMITVVFPRQGTTQTCPSALSTQLIGWSGSQPEMPDWYGVDIAGSTTGQDTYNIVVGNGRFSSEVDSALYDTSNHSLLQATVSNALTPPSNYDFTSPRTDNLNLLGFIGAWIQGWTSNTPEDQKGYTRDFGSDMSPFTPQENQVCLSPPAFHDFVDVAAIPYWGTGVVFAAPDSFDFPPDPDYMWLQLVNTDGSLGNTYQASSMSSSDYMYPSVAAATPDSPPAMVVANWTENRNPLGTVYFNTFTYEPLNGTLLPLGVHTVGTPLHGLKSEVAAVPAGFVVAWLDGVDAINLSVKMQSFNWDGTPASSPLVVSSSTGTYDSPAIGGGMWALPGQTAQPYFAITYTRNWYAYGTNFIIRYVRFVKGFTSPTFISNETIFSYVSGQSFYGLGSAASEYRNAVDLFVGCPFSIVAGITWIQSRDSDNSLLLFKKFISVTPPRGALSGSSSMVAINGQPPVVDTALIPMLLPEDLNEKPISLGSPLEIESPELSNTALDEPASPLVPSCYDYHVGSCVGK